MTESRDQNAQPAPGAAIDTGPLSWVIGEIRESYAKAVAALENYGASNDATQLRHAKNYIHQANGALQIVDLDGVADFAAALEALAEKFESDPLMLSSTGLSVFRESTHALTAYLEELIAGEPHQPLRLFPYYRDVQAMVGQDRIHPADLFFPDLEVRVPRAAQAQPLATNDLLRRRARFERALLGLMRGPDPQQSARELKEIVGDMARGDLTAAQRALWAVAEALFDGIATGGLKADVQIKQLAGRINMQIRRLAEGSTAVAERLLKDILFYVSTSSNSGEAVNRIKNLFQLHRVVPGDLERRRYEEVDPGALRALKKQLEKAKGSWNKVVGGATSELAALSTEMHTLAEGASGLHNVPVESLTAALAAVAHELAQGNAAPSEALALEYATALLFLENSLDHAASADHSLAERAAAVAARVRAASKGETLQNDAPWLDEMTRRAQERQTLSTLVGEIQSNLRTVENALDGFFRDPANKTDLPQIDKQLQQIAGAFSILGQDEARAAIQVGRDAVQRFLAEDYQSEPQEFERLASSFGALGFFAETLQAGSDNPPARFRFDRESGIFSVDVTKPEQRGSLRLTDGETEPHAFHAAVETVEVQHAQHKQEVAQLAEELHDDPFNVSLHGQLKETLTEIRREAALIDSQETSDRAAEAISLLDQVHVGEDEADFSATMSDLSLRLAEVVQPSTTKPEAPAEPPAATPASEEAVDAELLEIFLTEAEEVLQTVEETLAQSREAPANQEHLTTIRRAFHTLKGSSRMVGLSSYGEAAWSVEQAMNLWLSEGRGGTPVLYALIAHAANHLNTWKTELQQTGRSAMRPEPVIQAAERVRAGESFHWAGEGEPQSEVAAQTEPAAAPVEMAAPAVQDYTATMVAPMALDMSFPELDDKIEEVVAAVPAEQPADEIGELVVGESVDGDLPDALGEEPTDAPLDLSAETALAEEGSEHIDLSGDTLADDVKRIGSLQVPLPLYNIFLAEADDMIRILGQDFAEWRHESHRGVSEAAVRAAHSLAGGSSTVGLQGVHDLAALLEAVLNGLMREPVALSAEDFGALDMAVDRLRAMLHQFAAEKMPEVEVYAEAAMHDMLTTLDERRAAGRSSDRIHLVPPESLPHEEAPVAQAEAQPEPEIEAEPVSSVDEGMGEADEEGILPAMTLELSTDELPDADLPSIEPISLEMPAFPEMPSLPPIEALPEMPAEPAMADLPPIAPLPPVQALESPAPVILPPVTPMMPAPATMAAAAVEESAPAAAAATDFATEAIAAVRDEVDADLLPVFVEEASDQLPHIGETLRAWQQAPGDASHAPALMRQLHTVKGSARMAGAMRLGQVLHEMETRVEHLALKLPAPHAAVEELLHAYDVGAALFDELVHGKPAVLPQAAPQEPPKLQDLVAGEPVPDAASAAAADDARAGADEGKQQAQQMVRIRADILERLVNQAGEVSISRSKLENEIATVKSALVELTDNLARLRGQLREIEIQAESQLASRREALMKESDEFDPLEFDRFTRLQELTRMMAESVNDVATVQQSLMRSWEGATRDLTVQSRLTRDLQQDLLRMRMVPFASVSQRLYRVARQTAKELDKRVNLEVRGGQVEVDRSVLERMVGPFEHLLRNSIVHGVEPRAERVARGKSETGELSISVRQDGNEVLIEVIDDGAGLDFTRIREKAFAQGLFAAGQTVTDRQLSELIFQSGFSTAHKVTELAGRGVGMDVVRAEAGALGGRVLVDSTPGKGTRFTISLPLTLASTQVVLVRVGERVHALPSAIVELVQQFKPAQLQAIYQQGYVERHGEKVKLIYLSHMLGDREQIPVAQRYSPVIICRSGNDRIALHIDEVLGNQEVVVKNIGPQLARMIGIAGASVLGSGDIVLILNPVQLAQRAEMHQVPTLPATAPDFAADVTRTTKPVTELETLPTIMVVDDSLTVRRVTQRLLTREGYQVVLAKDGVDALRQLQDYTPDVMLVDIEMPRMDGFDLTRNVRGDDRFRNIPIIMITSRTADKHRRVAMELGVNIYLGKPYQEDELLNHISGFLGDKKRAAAHTAS
jgi:chemosensory pili system protein ChpA (sensor histidine kinase/response regulator)